jgi:hypothetical protein
MPHMIEIRDSDHGLLAVTLPMLLSEIGLKGSNLHWSLFYLYATGNLGDDKSMVDFEDEISNLPNGFCLSWGELNKLSVKFDQMFDALIIGSSSKDSIKKYDEDEDLYSNYAVVIDLFDGAYWRVYAEDEHLIGNLANRFSDIELSR